ncbi:MAG: FtsX-like permease family protein [Nitrospirae bacterium]|uniref:cell division protein FtsX n=1 Tax=Candidatus Magnetobacterium casense TaxID=1455061 RepID=UPI00058C89F7|nr:permease-like cell division protein FtsX [Candidatus Magnetobacterium casensis]MBF0337873.1 FtsX-like permease family protein [Nitrospirota bacterium]
MFPLRLAIQSILKEFWINLLTVLSIGALLMMLFAIGTIVYNIETMTRQLPEKLSILVFLKDNTTESDIKVIEARFKSEPLVRSVEFISKDQALNNLKKTFKEDDFVLKGITENPLSDSFEIKLKGNTLNVSSVKEFIGKIKTLKNVDDIEHGGKLLESVYAFKQGLRVLGIFTGTIFGTAVIFICYSTVRLLFYRRMDEIEIYRLLGATRAFVRAPFFIEGAVIGFMGGVLGTILLWILNSYLIGRIMVNIPVFSFIAVPFVALYFMPVLGLVLGLGGVVFALGRLKY